MVDDKVALLTPTNGKKQFWRLMLQNIKQQQYPHENITWYILDDSTKKSNNGLHEKIDFFKEQLAPIQVVFKSRKKCQSLGKKRNLLVEMTKDEPYLLHMDDDDFYQPNWIKSCVDGLKNNQGKGLIGSVVLPTCFIHERKDKTCVQLVKAGDHPSHVYPGTLAYTRDYYNQFGGFSDVDKNEAVEFANHNQTLVMNPHAPIMRLTPHPQAKHVWKTVTRPDVESGKDVNATIPDPLMEMFGKCAFDDEKFVFENPDDKLPNVGLAMPTYCRKRFYPNIIDNLKRQTYPLHKLTLYIYDDSPPGKGFHEYVDEMREKIHPVKLVFISGMEQIKPLGKKRNELVKYIQEPYIANMDDDDFYHPTWLRRVITVLLDNPDKGLVGCVEMPHIYIHSQFDKWKLILNNPNAYKMPEDKKKLEFIGEASMAYTREYFESQGGYGEQMIQEGVKFIDPKRTIDISCLDILISVNLHPDEVGHVSWNTSNKNMLFDKQQVGFNMPPEQALKIARCAFNDQNFNFGDSNPFKLPEIAVVTPTRDSAAFENVMIENMKRQTYPHELIHWYILDDSNDKNAMVSEENIRKKLGDKIKLVFKKLPKAVNPIGLKRNLLVKGVKQDIVVHMDDAQHYMKAYVNIMVTELRSNEKRKVVGSGVTPYVYVHEDLEKWKLIGMAFGPANDPMTICPTMMAYYKSYFDERDGFGGNEIPLQQQHPWMGQEVKKMIDPPKAHTIQALDKLMMYLCSHPESSKQTQRVGWDTTFAYKWFQNNGSDLDKLQISDNDKQTIARGVFGDNSYAISGSKDDKSQQVEQKDQQKDLLYTFVSCMKKKDKWDNIHTMMKELKRPYIIVSGGAKKQKFDEENNILYLKCNDYYEGLPEKVIILYQQLLKMEKYKDIWGICKVDDDMFVSNKPNDELKKYHYSGGHIYGGNRRWHIGRCSADSKWNKTEYPGEIPIFCSGGKGYMISRKSMEYLSNHFENVKEIGETEVFEDVMVSKILKKNKIFPQNINGIHEWLWSPEHSGVAKPVNKQYNDKQMRFKQCLYDYNEIMNIIGQDYFIIDGTLLGFARDKKFIDHDYDIDTATLKLNHPNIKYEFLNRGWRIGFEFGENHKSGYEIRFIHRNGVPIDLMVYGYQKADNVYKCNAAYCHNYSKTFKYMVDSCTRGIKLFDDNLQFEKVNFMDIDVKVPYLYIDVLNRCYGSDCMFVKKPFVYEDAIETDQYKSIACNWKFMNKNNDFDHHESNHEFDIISDNKHTTYKSTIEYDIFTFITKYIDIKIDCNYIYCNKNKVPSMNYMCGKRIVIEITRTYIGIYILPTFM